MNAFINKIKPYWPEIVAIAAAVWGVVGPQVQAEISAHPRLDSVLAAVVVILARALPSSVGAK